MPSLRELKGELIRITSEGHYETVDKLSLAQGVKLLCPKCYLARGKTKYGVHSVICWFADRKVPPDLAPLPGRWHPIGTSIDDLEFIGPGSFSVQLTAGCMWHGYIKNGRATILPS